MVSIAGLAPRVASVPALIAGSVVMFVGQKLFAFRARGGDLRREALLFALVQAGGVALNALLYDLALRAIPAAASTTGVWYLPVRLGTTNLVWIAYSFPLWHWVFKARPPQG
jgi:putative flippase GtrA